MQCIVLLRSQHRGRDSRYPSHAVAEIARKAPRERVRRPSAAPSPALRACLYRLAGEAYAASAVLLRLCGLAALR
jgi:hypothetical protein